MRAFLLFLFIGNLGFTFTKQRESQGVDSFSKAINPSKEILSEAKRFNKRYGNKWQIKFNQFTGLPGRIFGYHTEQQKGRSEDIVINFLSENKDFFKIEPKNIKLLKKEKRSRFNHVIYQQVYQGILVENANITVSLTSDGKIISVSSNYCPDIKPLNLGISKEKAIEVAKKALNSMEVIKEEADLVIFLREDKGVLCWKIRLFCKEPLGDWIYYIDATEGSLVEKYNNIRFQIQGRVMGKVFPSVGKELLFLVPFRHQGVNIGTTCVITNDDGYYNSTEMGLILSELKGLYVDIDNEDKEDVVYTGGLNEVSYSLSSPHPYPNNYNGTWTITHPGAKRIKIHFSKFETEAEFDYVYIYNGSDTVMATYTGTKPPFWTNEVEGDTIKIRLESDESGSKYGFDIDKYAFSTGTIIPSWIWDYPPQDSSCDEVNVFYHINLIHDYYKNTLGFSNMDYQMKATVRYETNYDNAFYYSSEESVYFGEGGDYENFARSSDVIYHEYTHATVNHIYNLLPYGQSGAMDEAFADYFTASMSNDSNIGEWLLPQELQRNLVNNLKYPEDWKGEIHSDSRIYSACLWEIRESIGKEKADKLIFESLFFQPQSFKEGLSAILLVDDNDCDLSNGTPHKVKIENAFLNHGITLQETLDTYEPNDSFFQSYPLISGKVYESYISTPGDIDYYKILASSNISISLVSIPFGADYDLYLYNASFKIVAKSINEGSINENIYYEIGTSSGVYYVVVVAWKNHYSFSNSYLLQASFSSDLLDNTPPLGLPGTPTSRSRYSSSTITFTWTQGTADDPESGIGGYWLQVGTEPGNANKFDGNVGNVLSKTIPNCEDGKTYYARVRARNGVGLYGSYSATSNGITIDATPPIGIISTPIGKYSTSTSLSFSWTQGTADDPESGIGGYWLQVGTELNNGDKFDGDVGNVLSKSVFNCTDERTYYARVRARNNASLYGNYSPFSNGVVIDIPQPILISVNPKVGLNTSSINVVLNGTGFTSEAIVKLSRDGEPDIIADKVVVESPNKITCKFNLSKIEGGKWNVVVNNTQIKKGLLKNGFKVLMSPTGEGVSRDGKIMVELTPFAVGEGYYIDFDLNPYNPDIDIANQKDDFDPSYNRVHSSIVKIVGYNENDAIFTNNFTAPATITISYSDIDQDGIVDDISLIERELAVYKLVGTGSLAHWKKIQGSIVNCEENTVSAPITSFSTYILIGQPAYRNTSLKGIYVYPNPAFPKNEKITFKGLPVDGVKIRIYNIACELIIEKEIFGDCWIWDMRNKKGKMVASGVYMWMITDNRDQKAFGKIGIIK